MTCWCMAECPHHAGKGQSCMPAVGQPYGLLNRCSGVVPVWLLLSSGSSICEGMWVVSRRVLAHDAGLTAGICTETPAPKGGLTART